MQNFTLGKKVYSLLLFLLVLLIGSTSSYGQCPTPAGTEASQEFCFLATVGDIQRDGTNTAVYQTADNTNDTQPIPSSEILSDDTTYFVGGQSGTCTRIPVAVNVIFEDYPNNRLVPGENSFTISPCESNFTAEQLATYFDPITGYEIRVYEEEFGNTEATGPLTPNDSYFVGQVSTSGTSSPDNCPSLRVAVGYDPQPTPPPTATSPQTFCDGATVGDLEAQGTSPNTQSIRWYRTATSFQPLPDSTILINGTTYYATQVINDRNDPFPPCESDMRAPVQVILQDRTNVESTQEFCASIGEGNDFRMPQVRDLSPEGGTFFAEENSTTPLDPNTVLVEGEDYFNRDNGAECSQDRITVVFRDTPNAGSTTQTTTCENETPFNLVDRINDSQLGEPDRDGTFSPPLSTGTQIFNPADYSPGTYTFNYNVSSTSSCPDDTAVISVEVLAAPNAGPGGSTAVCSNDIPTILANPAQFAGLLPAGITPGGTLSPTLDQLAAQFLSNPSAPLTTEYTVTSGNGCSDSATYTVNVIPSPNAGDDSSVTLSTQQDPVNLFNFINGNPDNGGTFSPGNANGDLDPADYTPGDYTFTYTVTSANGCTDSSDLAVTITDDIICPVIEDTTQEFCESISDANGNNPRRPQVRDLMPMNITWYATATSTEALSPTETLLDNEDYFAGNANGDCPNRERVIVQIDDAPNAGATTNITACRNEAPFDIVSRLNPSILGAADAGGIVTPALASGTTVFNPAVDPAGQYTYTVQSENGGCADDSAFFNVTITEPVPANAGPDVNLTFCSTAGVQDLFQSVPAENRGGSFDGLTNGIFDPATATIGENTIVYTLDSNDGCFSGSDTATFTINVTQGPNAGDDSSVTLSTQQDPVNLFTFIQGNPDTGGTFSPGNPNGDLDPADYTAGEYTFTYTVTSANGCTDSSDLVVTITDEVICPVVADNTQEFCESISDADGNNPRRPQVRDLMPMNITWYATATSTEALSPTETLLDNEDYFAGNANGDCPNRERVIVQIDKAPNAGATTNITACSSEAPFDIVSRLNPSILGAADAGGTVTPALASGTTVFNPAVDPAGQYTYRVQSENSACEDDTTIVNITITQPVPVNAGADVSLTFCSTAGVQNLFNSLPAGITGGSFEGLTNGMFDPATAAIGDNTIIFTQTAEDACVTGSDTSTFTINVTQGPNAGDDSSVTLSTQQDPVNLFNYIDGNPDSGGTFSPGNSNGDLDPADYTAGDYTFTYTVTSSNGCSDSSDLVVTITNDIICPVIADNTQEFCESVSDADGNNPRRPQVRDLMPMNITWYATATSIEALSPTATLLDNEDYFAGNANGDCPNRERVIVQIDKAPNAGSTTNITACNSEDPFDIVSRLNPSILGAASAGGTITPALASGTTVFNPAVDPAGQYTYRVQSENSACEDDTTFVNINITQPVPANAGADVSLTFCSTDGVQNLFNSLPSGITGGSFAGLTNGIFNPATATIGENVITYTLTSSDACVTGTDTSTFTITVNEPQDANAGGDVTAIYCIGEDQNIDLTTLLGDDALRTGSFSAPYENGSFNPSEAGVGVYTISYSVDGAANCAIGTDTATITITVNDVPDAPTAAAIQSFCLIDNPTVGDIVVTGDNVVIYTDDELTNEADATTALVSGRSYYAVSTNDTASCSSESVVINVTITDPAAPTLQLEGNEFCRSDNPTIQELIGNLNGSGIQIYTSNSGGTAITATTPLQDGVTYYATSTETAGGCESSERLAIAVEVNFCGIPEGFSPNGDGINDQFVIPDIAETFPNYTIEIFNRWGNVVFKGNANTDDWNGISNQSGTLGNDVLPVGVYFYILNYNDGQTSPVQGKLYLSI